MTDPAAIGARVLAALEAGRRMRAEDEAKRIADLEAAIEREIADDVARGRPARGRPGRIARRLRGLAKLRTVQKYCARLSERAHLNAFNAVSGSATERAA